MNGNKNATNNSSLLAISLTCLDLLLQILRFAQYTLISHVTDYAPKHAPDSLIVYAIELALYS